jgi:hypothetical protein
VGPHESEGIRNQGKVSACVGVGIAPLMTTLVANPVLGNPSRVDAPSQNFTRLISNLLVKKDIGIFSKDENEKDVCSLAGLES